VLRERSGLGVGSRAIGASAGWRRAPRGAHSAPYAGEGRGTSAAGSRWEPRSRGARVTSGRRAADVRAPRAWAHAPAAHLRGRP